MKKIATLFIFCFFSLSPFLFSQQNTFRLTYDVAQFDITGGMVENSTGELVVAGLNANFIPYFGNVFKIDSSGNMLWAKSYTGGIATNFSDIKNISTGGYIITGSSSSGGAILVKIDNSGNIVWAKRYQLPNHPSQNASSEWGTSVIETSDGGFLVGGGVDYFWDGAAVNTVDTTSALGFKTDALGNLLWSKVWTLTNPIKVDEHYINDVAESADGYFFVGESADETQAYDSDGNLPRNALLIKTDKAVGTTTYIRRWGAGGTSSQGINCALRLVTGANAGKILLGGYDDIHAFLITVDGTGGAPVMGSFNRRISGAAFPPRTLIIQDIMENADGNYSVIGMQIEPFSFLFYTAIYKINSSSGALIFGRGYTPIGLSAILPEGGLLMNGGYYVSMTDQQAGGFNYNILRTNSLGQLGAGPAGCNSTSLNPPTAGYAPGLSTPASLEYNLAAASAFAPLVSNISPVQIQDCYNVACAKPPATASAAPATICAGQSTTLTATGGGTYSWSTGATSPTIVVSPAGTTVYTATVTAGGCDSIPPPVTVTVNPLPSASISGNTNICVGQSTTLTASGGGTYSWWNNGATTVTITDTPAATTNYTVTVTSAAGCTNTAVTTVTVNSLPTANISGASAVCSGSSVTLTASGGTSYSWWNNGATSATITDAPATTTTYTVTVSNGSCSSTTSTTVTVNSLPSAAISGNTNICQGETTTLTASGGGTYLWDNSATTPSIIVNPAATTSYTVTVTNGNGCTDVAVTTVNVAPPPVASVSGNNTICAGQSTILSASGGLTYSWNTTATTSSITVSPAISTTYSVIVSAGNCSDTTSITVTVNPSPIANINTASTSICTGQSTTLTATGVGTYSWSTGATTNPIIVSPTGATSYSVIVSNGNCTDTASVTISVLPPVTASVSGSNSTICSGASATLTASGGTIYSWSSGQTTSSITVSPATSTNYTVIVSNGSCADTATASIAVNPSPTASIAGNNSICAGQGTTLTATGGGTYLWNTGATTNTILVSPTSTTSYTVTVTATNGCTASAVSSVTVTPIPNAVISASTDTICSGTFATLTASGGGSYLWNPGGQTSPSIVVSPSANTSYTVTVSNGGCASSASTSVTVNPSPTANTGTDITINYGDAATLTASGGGTYSWSTGDLTTSIIVNPVITTDYCVTVTDTANGCIDTSCVRVTIEFNCGELFIPNAFSPNGDLKNDYFRPRNICFKTFHLVIYDRWGVKVFEEKEDIYTKGWDGMYKGKIGETAVFNYYFSYELVDGKSDVKKGTVSLIR